MSLHGGTPASLPSSVSEGSGNDSLGASNIPLNATAQLSPAHLAAIAKIVRYTLAVQARVSQADSVRSVPSSVPAANVAVDIPSLPSSFCGTFGSQSAALLVSGTVGTASQWPPLSAVSIRGRPAFVFPSFVSTFEPPIPSLVSSGANASVLGLQPGLAGVSQPNSTLPAPILHQPFVAGPVFSPIPAKLVSQIVTGKFVELNELLSSNIVHTEPEPQLIFDGRLVLTPLLRKPSGALSTLPLGWRHFPASH